MLYKWTPERRQLDYLRLLGASNASAKEVKIFNLAPFLTRRARVLFDRFYEEIYPYAGIFAPWIGTTGGTALTLGKSRPVPVAELRAAHEGWFPAFMSGEIAA